MVRYPALATRYISGWYLVAGIASYIWYRVVYTGSWHRNKTVSSCRLLAIVNAHGEGKQNAVDSAVGVYSITKREDQDFVAAAVVCTVVLNIFPWQKWEKGHWTAVSPVIVFFRPKDGKEDVGPHVLYYTIFIINQVAFTHAFMVTSRSPSGEFFHTNAVRHKGVDSNNLTPYSYVKSGNFSSGQLVKNT